MFEDVNVGTIFENIRHGKVTFYPYSVRTENTGVKVRGIWDRVPE
jgi:hypothetical protein